MIQLESLEFFFRNFFTSVYINSAIFTILTYDTRKSQGLSVYVNLTQGTVITADREGSSNIKTYSHTN